MNDNLFRVGCRLQGKERKRERELRGAKSCGKIGDRMAFLVRVPAPQTEKSFLGSAAL